MGKASRKQRGSDGAIITTRSAWVAVYRELMQGAGAMRALAQNGTRVPDTESMRLTIQGHNFSVAAMENESLRVVKVKQAQATALVAFELEALEGAAALARPPFSTTFLDLDFVPVSDEWRLVGAVVQDQGTEWLAVAYSHEVSTGRIKPIVITCPKVVFRAAKDFSAVPEDAVLPMAQVARRLVMAVLVFLESANIELVEAMPLPRAHQAAGIPHLDVIVRQTTKRFIYPDGHEPASRDWSHRWEVRGHFKHFRRGRVFDNHPDRRIKTAGGDEFVRIWCPPHVKGPQDKPLVPKLRVVADAAVC